MAKLTGAACRAGRALLKWSMRQLVEASNVSLPTILKLENDGQVSGDTAAKIIDAFDAHGVEITNGDGTGARLRFIEAWPQQRGDGTWGVLTRWREGAPLDVVSPQTAREGASEARRRGDLRTADALDAAAEKAERYGADRGAG